MRSIQNLYMSGLGGGRLAINFAADRPVVNEAIKDPEILPFKPEVVN